MRTLACGRAVPQAGVATPEEGATARGLEAAGPMGVLKSPAIACCRCLPFFYNATLLLLSRSLSQSGYGNLVSDLPFALKGSCGTEGKGTGGGRHG